MTLSDKMRGYLRAIHSLRDKEDRVTVSEVADHMGVAAASASHMMKRLAELELVEHTPYRGVELTEEGEREALLLIRRHRIVELFLTDVVGLPWDQVHQEAERLEHAVSDQLLERIAEILGHPTVDPHGDPIPTEDGLMEEDVFPSLADLRVGQKAVVRRVTAQDPSMLQYLASIGLMPEQTVTVLSKEPFEGPLTLLVKDVEKAIGWKVARKVKVSEL